MGIFFTGMKGCNDAKYERKDQFKTVVRDGCPDDDSWIIGSGSCL